MISSCSETEPSEKKNGQWRIFSARTEKKFENFTMPEECTQTLSCIRKRSVLYGIIHTGVKRNNASNLASQTAICSLDCLALY